MLFESRGVFEELADEVARDGLLHGPVLSDGLGVEVLPEHATVAPPPLPIRHKGEVEARPGSVRILVDTS